MTPPHTKFKVVFFDIGDTLGSVSTSAPLTLAVFPGVKDAITELHKSSVRMGVVSRIGDLAPAAIDQMLKACGLFTFFDAGLLHYIKGNTPKDRVQFKKALGKAKVTNPALTLFIGENQQEREQAALAGMRVGARVVDAPGML